MATSGSKPKSSLSKQYETALLGAPEVTEKKTKTTSRTILAASKPQTTVGAAQAPVTRLASPKTLKKTSSVEPKIATTKIVTEVHEPVTAKGVEERLKGFGYAPIAEFAADGVVEAVYAVTPYGEKVLIRTHSHPTVGKSASDSMKRVSVEPADDPVVGEDTYRFYLEKLITDARLGARIDTDFAIMTPDGVSVWTNDGTSASHWLYADPDAVGEVTGLREGTFVLASVELDALKEPATRGNTIVDRLYEPPMDPDTEMPVATFGVLIQLLRMTGLLEVLRSGGPYTLLAPTDEAFAKLPEGVANDLVKFSSRQKLASILEYHVYADKQDSKVIGDEPTVQGEMITFDKTQSPVTANDANVLYVDLGASNGVIHIIDKVLVPANPGAGALTGLLEPVDADDIDYTTQRIRQTMMLFNDRAAEQLADSKERIGEALSELSKSRSQTVMLANSALAKTKRYNTIAEDKSRTKEALVLAEEISLDNDKVDANIMRQNEINELLSEVDILTARIKALASKLRQTAASQ